MSVGRVWPALAIALAACSRPREPGRASSPPEQDRAPLAPTALSIAFAGDTMLARGVDELIRERGPRYIWGNALSLIRSQDLTLVNLECVIATSGTPFVPPRVFYFRAAPPAIDALLAAGIDYAGLANNHAMDYESPALLETLERLDRAGIGHAGAGRNLDQAERPALMRARGRRVGVVAFADHFSFYGASATKPGTNVISITTEGSDFERVKRALARAREAGADLVVFSIHWGPNMRDAPTPDFVRFARAVLDAGADVFHGHSAHVFQGVELYRGKPILYDTGDLIDDYEVDETLRNDRQLFFVLHLGASGKRELELVPLLIDDGQLGLAEHEDFAWIEQRVRTLSAPFGTEIERSGRTLRATAAER